MQINLNRKSDFFNRLMQIIDYKGFKNLNDFAKNALNYSSPEKLNRLKDENNKPSVSILCDISNKFEDISIEWLLMGKGDMIKKNHLSPPEPTKEDRYFTVIESQQRIIESQQRTIEEHCKQNK